MTKKLPVIILALLMILALPVSVRANSAEPPGMTIIVENAPSDISVTLVLADELEEEIRLYRGQKRWEVYFWFYHHMTTGSLHGASLRVESSEKCFTCSLPQEAYRGYNNLFTLDFEDETLVLGQRWWRQPALTAVRVTLTLLVEGLVFFVFGFRQKRSWFVFLIINLMTQGWLNYIINRSAFTSSYVLLGLYLAEFVILFAEVIVFSRAATERKWWQRVLFVLVGNAASFAAGLILINRLPI